MGSSGLGMRNRILLGFCSVVFLFNSAQSQLYPRKMQGTKYGYVDHSSSLIIKDNFDKAFAFDKDLAKVIVKGRWGLIDKKGDYLVKPNQDYIGWSNDGYFLLNRNNLSLTNNRVPTKHIFYPSELGQMAYYKNEKWGLIDANGKLHRNEWDSINHGNGGHFPVFRKDRGWTWIDTKNESPKDFYFSRVHTLSNGIIAVLERGNLMLTLLNDNGQKINQDKFDEVGSLNDDFIKVKKFGYWAYADKAGKLLSPFSYEEIKYNLWTNTLQLMPSSKWLKCDVNFSPIDSLNFDISYQINAAQFVVKMRRGNYLWNGDTLFALREFDSLLYQYPFLKKTISGENTYTLYDNSFLPVIDEAILDHTKILNDNYYAFRIASSEKWLIYDLNNQQEIMRNINDFTISNYHKNEILIEEDRKLGLFDIYSNKWIINKSFDNLLELNDSIYVSKSGDTIAIHSKKNGQLHRRKAFGIKILSDSLIALKNETNEWKIFNQSLKPMSRLQFIQVENAEGIFIRVKSRSGWGLLNIKKDFLQLKMQYDSIESLASGFRIVRKGKSFGIVNEAGFFTFQLSDYYQRMETFQSKRMKVFRNGLAGLSDQNGTLKISTQYEDLSEPNFSYIPFKFRSKWGLLDEKERIMVQPLNDSLKIRDQNIVQVWKNTKTGILNFQDEPLIEIKYDSIHFNKNGSYTTYVNGLCGYFNSLPRQIRPPQYTKIKVLDSDEVALKKNGYWQVVDNQGSLKLDKKFSNIYFDSQSNIYFLKEKKDWILNSLD